MNNWKTPKQEKPICYKTGDWDGKRSDEILVKTLSGDINIGICYEGYMDGNYFFDWLIRDQNGGEFFINDTIKEWAKIPD